MKNPARKGGKNECDDGNPCRTPGKARSGRVSHHKLQVDARAWALLPRRVGLRSTVSGRPQDSISPPVLLSAALGAAGTATPRVILLRVPGRSYTDPYASLEGPCCLGRLR